jgi:hypothetical protein
MWNKIKFFVLLPSSEIGAMLIKRCSLDSSKHVSPPLTQKAGVESKGISNRLLSAICMLNTAPTGPLVN